MYTYNIIVSMCHCATLTRNSKSKFNLCAGDKGQIRITHSSCVLHLRVPDKPDSDDVTHHSRHSRPQQVRHVLISLSLSLLVI